MTNTARAETALGDRANLFSRRRLSKLQTKYVRHTRRDPSMSSSAQWPIKWVTLAPGWRWTEETRPVVGTDLGEVFHVKLFLQGRFGVRMKDGIEREFGPGEIAIIDREHDAWPVGNEPYSFIDRGEVVRQASAPT